MTAKPNHPYHLVDPSPWPIVGSIGIFLLLSGAVLYIRELTTIPFWLGMGLVVFTLLGWWRDVINEAKTSLHTKEVQVGFRYGMLLFIISEVMFFVAFLRESGKM